VGVYVSEDLEQFSGTLPQQMFSDPDGEPFLVDQIYLPGEWSWDGDAVATTFQMERHDALERVHVLGQSL
jgi:hypothetical protein